MYFTARLCAILKLRMIAPHLAHLRLYGLFRSKWMDGASSAGSLKSAQTERSPGEKNPKLANDVITLFLSEKEKSTVRQLSKIWQPELWRVPITHWGHHWSKNMFLKEIITANVHLTSKRALHLRKLLIVDLKRRLNRNIFPHLSVNLRVLTDYRHFLVQQPLQYIMQL